MSNERLQTLLKSLKDEIANLEDVDPPTSELVDALEDDINALLEKMSEPVKMEDTPMDTALALEAHFASRHPTAERVIGEIVDTLNKIGI